ncbi:MAG: hypothetical protein IJF84_00315 [Thermoguttaceae bacterium]|nr:hypothetical protein [Thermoguttaceae bacterium]
MTKYIVTCRGHARLLLFVTATSERNAKELTEKRLATGELSYRTGDLDVSDFYELKSKWLMNNLYSVEGFCDCIADFYFYAKSKDEAYELFLDKRQCDTLPRLHTGDLVIDNGNLNPVDVTVDGEAIDYFDDGFGYFGKTSNPGKSTYQTKLFSNI